ncbi:superoxide dismutase family protein [Altererythrobacter sp.]|nr:superoxide dismutase family protein [Altererythrobacter sp.]
MKLPRAFAAAPLLASAFALNACASLGDIPTERLGSAEMMLSNGIPAGTAQLYASGDTLSLAIAVTGISQGQHGFHLHAVGSCQRPDFTSAGGHLNPTGEGHGLEDNDGSHLGDLPNLTAGASGAASMTVQLRGTRAELVDFLFDADGTAVMIHADPDDGTSDPSGNAGSRIACGVLKKG